MRKERFSRIDRERAEAAVRAYPLKQAALKRLRENLIRLRQTQTEFADRAAADRLAQLDRACANLEVEIGLCEAEINTFDGALALLDDEERLVVERMLLAPIRDAAGELSEALCVETATVYRRRQSALEKIAAYLP